MALPAREGFFAPAAHGQVSLRTTSQSRRKLLASSPCRGASGEEGDFSVCQGLSYKERWHCEAMTERLDKGEAAHERKTQKVGCGIAQRCLRGLLAPKTPRFAQFLFTFSGFFGKLVSKKGGFFKRRTDQRRTDYETEERTPAGRGDRKSTRLNSSHAR